MFCRVCVYTQPQTYVMLKLTLVIKKKYFLCYIFFAFQKNVCVHILKKAVSYFKQLDVTWL